MERHLSVIGAYNDKVLHRYGQHGMELWFYVKGPKGGISFRVFTSWSVKERRQENFNYLKIYPFDPLKEFMAPKCISIDIHSKEPLNSYMAELENCEITDGKCFCSGSSLWAKEWTEGFVHGGSKWLFEKMEDYYRETFENGPRVDLTPKVRDFDKEKKEMGVVK